MNWTCEQTEARLSDYLDRLLAPEERGAFESHAAGCARCAPLVRSVEGLLVGMHRLEPLEPPPHLENQILDKTLGPRKVKKTWRGWLAWLRPMGQPRFAYGALSVVITFAVLVQALGIGWRKPRLADLNPVNIYRQADRQAHLIYARGSKFFTDLRVVYEIQSRLRPEAEVPAAPAPQAKPGPGQSNGPTPKSPRELNRANDKNRELSVLACMLSGVPARRLP